MQAMDGSWAPCTRILYGIVTFPFQPIVVSTQNLPTAPDQVALEIGDEVYTLELFRPDSAPASGSWDGTWHRGFVTTGQKSQAEPNFSDSGDAMQVFFGIWPSSHVQIREELDHVPLQTQQLQPSNSPNHATTLQRTASGSQRVLMEPLREEDEEAEEAGTANADGRRRSKRFSSASMSPNKSRNRLSLTSVASPASPANAILAVDSNPVSALETLSPSFDTQKPQPPLPSLKCGDETAAGAKEPLIDEVACALREWAQLLYAHLSKRDYTLFNTIKAEMESLHVARRQLLSGALSRQEAERVRSDLVQRLAKGNQLQGLDLIVRHHVHGALVEIDTPGPNWASIVQLYSMQAKLANKMKEGSRKHDQPSRLATHTSELFSAIKTSPSSQAHLKQAITEKPDAPFSSPSFYHLYLDVRAFVGSPCTPGETTELCFSIYNHSERRFLTEDFVVVLNHQGSPVHLPVAKMRTLFKDLTSQDLQDSLHLVCRLVKNGSFKSLSSLPPPSSTSLLSPPQSTGLQQNATQHDTEQSGSRSSMYSFEKSDGQRSSMVQVMSGSGQQSVRRPLGCAVLDLSFLSPDQHPPTSPVASASLGGAPGNNASRPKDEYTMPVFVPISEAGFATLHQDIIASRTSDFSSAPEKVRTISVSTKLFHGIAKDICQSQPELLEDAPLAERLGFPDVVEPELQRDDLYIRVESGLFESAGLSNSGTGTIRRGIRNIQQLASSSAASTNVEVSVEVRRRDGSTVIDCISRGAGEPMVSSFTSLVIKASSVPIFNENFKLVMQPVMMESCHLFFSFRNRSSKERSNLNGMVEKPFAFAWLPLFPDSITCLGDGTHHLQLYRYHTDGAQASTYIGSAPLATPVDKRASTLYSQSRHSLLTSPSSLSLNASSGLKATGASATLQPIKDKLTITSLSCSTSFTQDETLLKLLRFPNSSDPMPDEEIASMLSKLKYCAQPELAKHIQPVLDGLFSILVSKSNVEGRFNAPVFRELVNIFAIVSDRRFHNFRLIVDRYLSDHFHFTAHSYLLRGMSQLVSDRNENGEAPQILRSAIKVWPLLFRTIIRSRELQRAKQVGSDVTSDSIEGAFKRELRGIFDEMNRIMELQAPASIIGTQVLAMQHFASIAESVERIFSQDELVDIISNFCEAISGCTGKLAVQKLLLLARLAEGPLLNSVNNRSTVVPSLLRWVRPHLARLNDFELRSMNDAARETAQTQWLEAARAATVVLAAMLHKINVAIYDTRATESLLASEQDNIEFMLALLPRLFEYYSVLRDPTVATLLERNPVQMAAADSPPSVFPTAHPLYLLSHPAATEAATSSPATLRHLRGELTAVLLSLFQMARPTVLTTFLDATLEVEGQDHFTRLLSDLFRFEKTVVEGDAFPGTWLNFNLLAHRVVLKITEVMAPLMQRHYIPASDSTYLFNFPLWREYLEALLALLKSDQLVIEEFAPQKRRTVWRQAGDLRGSGAKLLSSLWNSLGWPDPRLLPDSVVQVGGYQVQLGPPFVDSILELCLSHHDELRSTAVNILFVILIGESRLNSDLVSMQNQVIDTLDRLFSQRKGDEVSRGFFISQLRSLFESANIDSALSSQVNQFLDSTSHFLDLLLGIRNLPPGDEYLTFSEQYCFSRLKDFHVQCGNYTEAGLVLKLHADLYEYDVASHVDAIPEYGLPRQSQFARKEALYLQILELLNQGKAWESALVICKELQERYEMVNFAYQRLSEILLHQSTLYALIVKEPRSYPNVFRVGYYGKGFPATVQNRQFVYRGNVNEQFSTFRERHLNKHPSAVALESQTAPDEELQNSDGQYIHICQVQPEPDKTFPIFQNPDVPAAVRSYYEHNGTNTFSFETKFTKAAADHARNTAVPVEFLSTWSLRTTLVCADAFPTVLKRTEVIEVQHQEISPVEKALQNVEKSIADLQRNSRKFKAFHEEGARFNANALSVALNAVVDPGPKAGVPLYKRAFLGTDFVVANPDKSALISQLRNRIHELTLAIHEALQVHGEVCAPDMLSFHDTLQDFFHKNFAPEIDSLLTTGSDEQSSGWGKSLHNPPSETTNSGLHNGDTSYGLPAFSKPAVQPKSKDRYSVSLGQETFGQSYPSTIPESSIGPPPPPAAAATNGVASSVKDTSSILSDGPASPSSIKRAGSLLRFGSITARRASSKRTSVGSK